MSVRRKPQLFCEDARHIDHVLQRDRVVIQRKISVTITSPPYHDLKDYGVKGQIGYGQAYDAYLADLKLVFKKVFDLTIEDGSLWVIIDAFKRDNELIPLPFDFAQKLKEVGWKLRDVVIWRKDRTVPWSKHGDTRGIFEYVLVFSKGANSFRYQADQVRERHGLKGWWVRYPERYNPRGKSLEGIWTFDIPTQGSWGNGSVRHFCPLPSGLVERILKLTTQPGDVVLDPFAGSGSVLVESFLLDRRAYGFELNRKYVRSFKRRLDVEVAARLKMNHHDRADVFEPAKFEQLIISLRVLKYARTLRKRLPKTLAPTLRAILVKKLRGRPSAKHQLVRASYILFAPDERAHKRLLSRARSLSAKPPLSKFGVEPLFDVVSSGKTLSRLIRSGEMYSYSALNTNRHRGRVNSELLKKGFHIVSPIAVSLSEADYA